jgi:hypothetical protein
MIFLECAIYAFKDRVLAYLCACPLLLQFVYNLLQSQKIKWQRHKLSLDEQYKIHAQAEHCQKKEYTALSKH